LDQAREFPRDKQQEPRVVVVSRGSMCRVQRPEVENLTRFGRFWQAENSACRAFIKEHRPEAVLPFLADIEYFQRGRQAWVAKASFGGVSGELGFEHRKD
jgi:hypothetical protein